MKKKPPLLQRLRQKKNERKAIVTGVCWYTESQWARLKETASDPERFEATFGEWNAMAEQALRQMRNSAILPIKVFIEPDEFFAWCKKTSNKNDASARAQYVSVQMRIAHEKNA